MYSSGYSSGVQNRGLGPFFASPSKKNTNKSNILYIVPSLRDAEAGGSNPLIPTSEITTTRYAGGLFRPYKGLLPASA